MFWTAQTTDGVKSDVLDNKTTDTVKSDVLDNTNYK
jgi:hypothetical protein